MISSEKKKRLLLARKEHIFLNWLTALRSSCQTKVRSSLDLRLRQLAKVEQDLARLDGAREMSD